MINLIFKKRTLLHIGLILILGFFVYANSLSGKFVWDDNAFIKDNCYINDWSKISNIFTENTKLGPSLEDYAYRPFQVVTHMLDYSLWRLNTFGYHLTNTLLHILVALTIYWLISLLYHNKSLSLLTSIFFVIYPGHTEAVSYISGRGDLLSTLFVLLSFIFYIKQLSTENKGLFILMLLSFALALLSKENALILPLLLLLYHYAFKQKINLKLFLLFLIMPLLYVLLRINSLGSLYYGLDIILKRIPGFFVAMTNYFRILLLPVNLHMDYGNKLFHITSPKALFGFVALFLLLIYAFKMKNKDKIVFFSVYWFFIALLPTSSVYPVVAFYMAEHFLYLPSIGFFVILANSLILLYNTKQLRLIAVGLIIFIVAAYSYLTIKQNNYWKEPVVFYKQTLRYAPQSANVHNNLGYEYLVIGDREKAVVEFQKAIEINPKMAIAYYNLGNIYMGIGDKEKAIAQFRKVMENKSNNASLYSNICDTYISIAKNEEAIEFCNKAIELKPAMAIAYYNLGNAYYNLGKKDEAVEVNRKAIKIDPRYIEAYNNLASIYTEIGKIDEAIELWNKTIQINPGFTVAHFNLAVFYFKQKKYDLAVKHCDEVINSGNKVDPKFLELLEPYRQ